MYRARLVCTVLAFLCLAGPADRALAAAFTLNVTTDPALGTIQNVADVDLHPGQVWKSAEIPISPIMVGQGDEVTVNVTFSGGRSLELRSGAFFSGNEEVGWTLHPLAQGTTIGVSSTLGSFSGLVGALDVVLPLLSSGTAINQISGDVTGDMTSTSFAFTGFVLHATYNSLTGGPVQLSSVQVLAAANDVTVVEAGNDRDGDGVADATDDCPDFANPGQEDTGGIGPGSPPDGIGDACQCGDVNGDGRVTLVDAVAIRRSLLQPPTAVLARPDLCDVGGSAGCSAADAVIVTRAQLAPPTATVQQVCAPAVP